MNAGSQVYLWGTLMGLGAGFVICVGGFVIAVMGLSGSIDWVIEGNGFASRLKNASPGTFFCLLGVFVLWIFKPKVTRSSHADSHTYSE